MMTKKKRICGAVSAGVAIALGCFAGVLGERADEAAAESAVNVGNAKDFVSCIDADASFGSDGLTVTQQTGTVDSTGYNDTIRMTWDKPVYLGDNTTDNSELITLDLKPLTAGTLDINALIVTVENWEKPSEYFNIAVMGYSSTDHTVVLKARADNQTYMGHYCDSNGGTYVNNSSYGYNPRINYSLYNGGSITFYYNNSTQRLFTTNAHNNAAGSIGLYNANGQIITDANEKYLVRDFNNRGWDNADINNGEAGWNKSFEKARISIEAVRRIKIDKSATEQVSGYRDSKDGRLLYLQNTGDEGSSLDYTCKRWSRTGQVSNNGSRFMIKSLDGQSLVAAEGSIADSGKLYAHPIAVTGRKVNIPQVTYGGIFGREIDSKELYVTVKDTSGTTVEAVGLNDGKWKDGSYFYATAGGDYTIEYRETQSGNAVGTVKATVTMPTAPDFDNIQAADGQATFTYSGNGTVTSASETGIITVGNSAEHNGVKLYSANNDAVAVFGKEIAVSELTKDKAFFEFMFLPETDGNGTEIIEVTVADAADTTNKFTTVLKKSTGPSGLTAVFAAGKDQDLYGMRPIRAGEYWKENREKGTDYGMYLSVSPQGKGFTGDLWSSPEEINTYNGTNSVIGLYYDNANKKLYATPDASFSGFSNEEGLVRNFGLSELDGYSGAKYTQTAWNGFTGDKVKVSVRIIRGDNKPKAGILVTKVGNYDLSERVFVDDILAYGVVNKTYPLPYARALTGGDVAEGIDSVGSIKITGPSGYTSTTVTTPSFIPNVAGKYTATYGVNIGGKTYGKSVTFTVLSEEEAAAQYPIVISPYTQDIEPDDGSDYKTAFRNADLSVGAFATTDLQLVDRTCGQITLTVTKDGASTPVKTLTAAELGETASIKLSDTGRYVFTYTAVDIVGRKAAKSYTVEIVRTAIEKSGDSFKEIYELGENVTVAASDVKAYDIDDTSRTELTSANTADLTTVIEYKKGATGTYAPITGVTFGNDSGEYFVRYTVSYKLSGDDTVYSATYVRKFEIADTVYPVLGGDAAVSGEIYTDGAQQPTDSAVYLRARTGTQIAISKPTAKDIRKDFDDVDLSSAVVVTFNKEGQDPEQLVFDGATVNKKLTETGRYFVTVSVKDGANNESKITYTVNVKDNWLTFGSTPEFGTKEVKSSLALTKPKLYDNDVESNGQITVKVFYKSTSGEVDLNVTDDSYTLPYIGEYIVEYSATAYGETVTARATVVAKDTQNPAIDVSEIALTGKRGERFEFIVPTATDNYDPELEVTVQLVYGDTVTLLTEPHFIPDDFGDYVLRFTCTDSSGNTVTEEVTVVVAAPVMPKESNYTLAIVLGCVGGALFIGGAAVLCVIAVRRKKKTVNSADDADSADKNDQQQ